MEGGPEKFDILVLKWELFRHTMWLYHILVSAECICHDILFCLRASFWGITFCLWLHAKIISTCPQHTQVKISRLNCESGIWYRWVIITVLTRQFVKKRTRNASDWCNLNMIRVPNLLPLFVFNISIPSWLTIPFSICANMRKKGNYSTIEAARRAPNSIYKFV